ncbi:MAG: AMP-binding protein [Clostridia bacterium]|nr:AMP-binding protein [Clostridia bacterium]
MLETSCKEHKDRIAYYTKEFGDKSFKEIKYEQLLEDVNALGTALLSLGLKDKKIAIIGENRYYWACSYLAIMCGVGIVVPLDRVLPKQEIESCLERAKVSVLIYSDKAKDTIDEIAENDNNKIEFYIGMDKKEDEGNNLSFTRLLEMGRQLIEKGDRRFIDAPMNIDAVAEILFTSGTTSKSKAVMLSQKNIIFNIYQHNKMIGIRKEDIFLSFLPIHHVYECVCGFLTPIYRGAAVSYCQGLRYIQEDMKEAHISVFLCVPLVFESMYKKIWTGIDKQGKTKLVKNMIKLTNVLQKLGINLKRKIFKDIHNQFGGNVRLFIAGAASVNPETCSGFRNFGISTVQGYGLSECAPIVALNRDTYYKDDAIGLPLEGTEIKIENINEDGIGEICTKGDHVMLGYYENEEATNEAIKDGWFYTGDLGYMDKDGFIHMTGRKKNVLITKNGKNVYPEELEEVLNNSDYISESMVYLKGDNDNSKLVADLILNKEYIENKLSGKTTEEIKQIVWNEVKKINQNMVIYKHITEINIREKEFEKTTTLKIKRYMELKK